VRLTDVATVLDGVENVKQAAWPSDPPSSEHSAAARREHHRRGRPRNKLLPQLKGALPVL